MFLPTVPQVSLLESQFLLPEAKRQRLEASWAHAFQQHVLPRIDEESFRDAFSEGTGRPNKSIRLLTGLHLLKDLNDLTDAQVLDQFEFNLQWHYALGVEPDHAHVCQKTLHNFRVLLMLNDRAQTAFESITRGLVELDGLDVGRQRLDSTHVISNISVLTRLGLFVETTTKFLRELRNEAPDKLAALNDGYADRYLDREGYFADATKQQARRRLPLVAVDVYRLVQSFSHDEAISQWESFRLLERLFEEQCEVVEGAPEDEAPVRVIDEPPASDDGVERACGDEPDVAVARETEAATMAESATESGGGESSDEQSAADTQEDTAATTAESAAEPGEDEPSGEQGAASAHEGATGAAGATAGAVAGSSDAESGNAEAPDEGTGQAGAPVEALPATEAEPSGVAQESESAAATSSSESADGTSTADEDEPSGQALPVKLREAKTISSSSLQSPHDPDATYGRKGKGYEVQVAETCVESNPYQVVTGIAVNGAHESDQHAVVPMIEQLEASQLKPDEMSADTGYGSGKNIIECAQRGVDLQAPVPDPDAPERSDPWVNPVEPGEAPPTHSPEEPVEEGGASAVAATPAAFGLEAFVFSKVYDEMLYCPAGQAPSDQHLDEAGRTLWAKFSAQSCASCPLAACCPTRSLKSGERTLRGGTATAATAHRQAEQQTPAFKERYKIRSGVEATNAELKGPHGADDIRVRGRARVEVSMLLKAMALNAKRAVQHHVASLREAAEADPAAAAAAAAA